jgi:polyisoprenoid-binding protein YceI
LLLLLVVPCLAEEITFYVNDDQKRDIVTFTSKAPLETVTGRTAEVRGFVTFDPQDIIGTAKGGFEVDLASLKTGINLRDKHMREQYLETDKYPLVIFKLTRVAQASSNMLENNQTVDLVLEGQFKLHGVTRDISIPVSVKFTKATEETKKHRPGNLLRITADFDVLLSDYNITRPQFVILKLDDNQKVSIDLMASTELPEVALAE